MARYRTIIHRHTAKRNADGSITYNLSGPPMVRLRGYINLKRKMEALERKRTGAPPPGQTPAAKPVKAAPAAAPPEPLETLVLPVYLSRHQDCRRGWDELERSLARVNGYLAPAGVLLSPTEPGEWSGEIDGSCRCPFQEDLDHGPDWLHLAFYPKLPNDEPRLTECGRCALISDGCDDRSLAQAVARLLGLVPLSNVALTDRLMSKTGSGTGLSGAEAQWLRRNAGRLLGLELPSSPLTVPIWAYEVQGPAQYRTGRTQNEVRQILDKVNLVWEQANITFQLQNWCHLDADEFTGTDPAQLAPITRYGARVLHLFFLNSSHPQALAHPPHHLALIPDSLEGSRTWAVARALGQLLGLTGVSGEDQLLGPGGDGFRLAITETVVARGGARLRLANQGAAPRSVDPPPPTPSLPFHFRLVLVRSAPHGCQLTLSEARSLVDEVRELWQRAGVELGANVSEVAVDPLSLEGCYPPGPSWTPLGECQGYDPKQLNVYLVARLPHRDKPGTVSANHVWSGPRIAIVAQEYPRQPMSKQLALTLAEYWGLKWSKSGPLGNLLTWQSDGTNLTPADIEAVRKALAAAGPAVSSDLPELVVPIQIFPGRALPAALVDTAIEEANAIWAAAGIRLEAVVCPDVEVDVDCTFPNDSKTPTNRKPTCEPLLAYRHPDYLSVFWAERIIYFGAGTNSAYQVFRGQRLMVVAAQYLKSSPGRNLARGLASLLGLSFSGEIPETRLTCYRGLGTEITPEEVTSARAQVGKLRHALSGATPLEDLPELRLPVAVHLLRHPEHGTALTAEQIRPDLEEAVRIWNQAGIRLVSRVDEVALDPEEALPSDKGQTQRRRSLQCLVRCPQYHPRSLNLFWLKDVVSNTRSSSFASVQDRPSKTVLLGEDKAYSRGKLLARTIGLFLGLSSNEYAAADQLMGRGGPGCRLSAADTLAARRDCQKHFPEPKFTTTLPLPIKLRCVRNGRWGCRLDEAAARDLWLAASTALAPARLDVQLQVDTLDVADKALEEAFPNPAGAAVGRFPMGIHIMSLPGHDPTRLCLYLLNEVPVHGGAGTVPVAPYPASKLALVAAHPTALEAALVGFLGEEPEAIREAVSRLFAGPGRGSTGI